MNVGEKLLLALMVFGVLALGVAVAVGLIFGVGWVCMSILGLSSAVAAIITLAVLVFVIVLIIVFVEG
jgi:hypothetical protein